MKRPGNWAANFEQYVPVCRLDLRFNTHPATFMLQLPPQHSALCFQSPARPSASCTQANPFSLRAYALLTKDTEGSRLKVALLKAVTPLLSAAYQQPLVSPLLATLIEMLGEGEVLGLLGPGVHRQLPHNSCQSLAATHLDISYNLRFALLALGPTAR